MRSTRYCRRLLLGLGSGEKDLKLGIAHKQWNIDRRWVGTQHVSAALADLDNSAFRLVEEACLFEVGLGPMNTVCNEARPTARDFLLSLGLSEVQIVGHPRNQFRHCPRALSGD